MEAHARLEFEPAVQLGLVGGQSDAHRRAGAE